MASVLAFSALGIAAMVGLTWMLGGLSTAVLADCDAALGLIHRDFIEFEASDGIVSVDGSAALFAPVEGERVGLVFAMGQRFATRLLSPGDVLSVSQVPAEGAARSPSPVETVHLELRFADFTQPRLRVELPVGVEAGRWRLRLEALGGLVGSGGT